MNPDDLGVTIASTSFGPRHPDRVIALIHEPTGHLQFWLVSRGQAICQLQPLHLQAYDIVGNNEPISPQLIRWMWVQVERYEDDSEIPF